MRSSEPSSAGSEIRTSWPSFVMVSASGRRQRSHEPCTETGVRSTSSRYDRQWSYTRSTENSSVVAMSNCRPTWPACRTARKVVLSHLGHADATARESMSRHSMWRALSIAWPEWTSRYWRGWRPARLWWCSPRWGQTSVASPLSSTSRVGWGWHHNIKARLVKSKAVAFDVERVARDGRYDWRPRDSITPDTRWGLSTAVFKHASELPRPSSPQHANWPNGSTGYSGMVLPTSARVLRRMKQPTVPSWSKGWHGGRPSSVIGLSQFLPDLKQATMRH